MRRELLKELLLWKNSNIRKSLLIKGARQVGKTYIVRELATSFESYCEINFEERPDLIDIFNRDLDTTRIIRDLNIALNTKIIPGKTLLFFDEIGDCPNAIKALRYFYENVPTLHVIASGSLLEFTIEKIGIPVGRVQFLHLYPMSFYEFIQALGRDDYLPILSSLGEIESLSEVLHKKLIELLGQYLAVGGMPEAVKKWIQFEEIKICQEIHKSIIEAYKHDFQKYAKKSQVKYLDLFFEKLPEIATKKFKFSNISAHYKSRELAPALELLQKAFLIHKVCHSSGNMLPIGAEKNSEQFKLVFIDIALLQALTGYDYGRWIIDYINDFSNKGPITESFIGQEIIANSDKDAKVALYYWLREKSNAQAEVDFLIPQENFPCPIEVKGGVSGSCKSLKRFLLEKKEVKYGLHLSKATFSKTKTIKSYPLYSIKALLNKDSIYVG